MPDTTDLCGVVARLELLEQRQRQLKGFAAAILGLAAAALTVSGMACWRIGADVIRPDADTVAATEFLLRDSEGKRYASLRTDEWKAADGTGEGHRYPVLEFYGGDGLVRIALTTAPNSTGIWLSGRDEERCPWEESRYIALNAACDHAMLAMGRAPFSRKNQVERQFMLGVGKEASLLSFSDVQGQGNAEQAISRASLVINRDESRLTLSDAKGESVFSKP